MKTALQRDLQIAINNRDAARTKLADLQGKHEAILLHEGQAEDDETSTRDARRGPEAAAVLGAPTAQLEESRAAHRGAQDRLAGLVLAREGLVVLISNARNELAPLERRAADLTVEIARRVTELHEKGARAALAVFADLMRQRHAVARLAGAVASKASGTLCEPIHFSSPAAGMLRALDGSGGLDDLLQEHGLSPTFNPIGGDSTATVDQLLGSDLGGDK